MQTFKVPARARAPRTRQAVLRALAAVLLLAATSAAAAADQSAAEPIASNTASMADDNNLQAQSPYWLPSGQGPLYSTTSTIVAALERWTSSSSDAAPVPRRLSLLKLPDPANLPPNAPNGSPSYGASLTAVRFTDRSVPAEQKRRAVLSCSTHARELITGETCFALTRLLAGTEPAVASAPEPNPATALWRWREMREAMLAVGLLTRAEASSAAASQAAFRARVAPRIARDLDLSILPILNAAARDVIERGGNYTLRKTVDAREPDARPQVDPNRSYPWKWEPAPGSVENAEDPNFWEWAKSSETFPGVNSAWPWEVRATVALLDGSAAGEGAKSELDAAIDVHSGIHALLFPLGYTCDLSSLPADRLDHWQRASDAAVAAVGPIIRGPTAPALYVAAGTTMEYAYGALGAKLASTPEIWGPDGRNQRCPSMSEWQQACGANQEPLFGVCACNGALGCVGENDSAENNNNSKQAASSFSSRYAGGGELTPWEAQREAQILRATTAMAKGQAAVPSNQRDAAAYVGGEVRDPGEADSAHYQPGKWPGGVAHGVDLADAIQMGEPVRNAGEQWFARDPYLRHWARVRPGERRTFAFFNPTSAASYRRTISDYAAGILAMLLTPPTTAA